MDEAMEQARRARNLVERLGARIPGFAGYLQRELRRDMDERVRRHLAAQLDRARREVAAVVADLPLQAGELLERLGRLEKELDGLAQRLRAAGAGYAGLFDALKVGEDELVRLYQLDAGLAEDVQALLAAVEQRKEGWEAELERLVACLGQALEERPRVLAGLL